MTHSGSVNTEIAELRDAAAELARGAGCILAAAFGCVRTIEKKGPIDLVTDADRASEEFIIREIGKRFPDHAIFSEEAGRAKADGPWRWVIDPLDGTTNFAHGLPHFAVLIAVQERADAGEFATRIAVTFDPLRDELFAAVLGAGATLNGSLIHISATERLVDSVLATGFAYDRLWSVEDNHAEFCRLNLLTQGVRRQGSAGLDLAYVASGRLDAFWEYKLRPWDLAGGILLVIEAGGRVTTVDGEPVALGSPSVAATNRHLHEALLAAVRSARAHPIGSRVDLDELLPPELRRRQPLP